MLKANVSGAAEEAAAEREPKNQQEPEQEPEPEMPAAKPKAPRHVMSTEFQRGQMIIVLARWILVLAGLMVALWSPQKLSELQIEVGVLLLVAIANFHLHAQLVQRRPTLPLIARAASIGDLVVITLLVALQGGASSNLYVFYLPALLAIAVAFRTEEAAALASLGVFLYAVVGIYSRVPSDVLLLRLLMLAAVVVIGNTYWRLHRERITSTLSARKEDAQDLFFGQAAALWARWFAVIGGALFVLARATTTDELARNIVPVVALLFMNFYLHGRYLVEQPANRRLTLLASGLDLVLISGLFITWSGKSGLDNPAFILFYPLVFSFALVFPPRIAGAFTLATLALYAGLVLPSGIADTGELKVLVERVLILIAMGGLGTIYWRMVRREVRGNAETSDTHSTLAWRTASAG